MIHPLLIKSIETCDQNLLSRNTDIIIISQTLYYRVYVNAYLVLQRQIIYISSTRNVKIFRLHMTEFKIPTILLIRSSNMSFGLFYIVFQV